MWLGICRKHTHITHACMCICNCTPTCTHTGGLWLDLCLEVEVLQWFQAFESSQGMNFYRENGRWPWDSCDLWWDSTALFGMVNAGFHHCSTLCWPCHFSLRYCFSLWSTISDSHPWSLLSRVGRRFHWRLLWSKYCMLILKQESIYVDPNYCSTLLYL